MKIIAQAGIDGRLAAGITPGKLKIPQELQTRLSNILRPIHHIVYTDDECWVTNCYFKGNQYPVCQLIRFCDGLSAELYREQTLLQYGLRVKRPVGWRRLFFTSKTVFVYKYGPCPIHVIKVK